MASDKDRSVQLRRSDIFDPDIPGSPPASAPLPASFVPTLLDRHLDKLRAFYDAAPTEPTAGGRFYRKLLATYYRNLIPAKANVLEIGCDHGNLLHLLPNQKVTQTDLPTNQLPLLPPPL